MSSVTSAEFGIPGTQEPGPKTKEFSFADSRSEFFETLLDIINPLQHIPFVATIYRAITGDEIAAPARLIGGVLFGGPIGFASAVANMLLEEASGNDLAGHALAFVGDLGGAPDIAAASFTPRTPPGAIGLAAADGGNGIIPELARAAAPTAPTAAATPPALQAPAILATAGGEIIWNGPRILPSLTRAPAVQSSTASDTAVEVSIVEAPATVGAPVKRSGGPAGPATTGAARPAPGARPAWLGAAIADAQSVQDAVQFGRATLKVEAQPWITDAMIEALDKYETLARERNR